jgi:hypothetical protein
MVNGVKKREMASIKRWLDNCGGYHSRHDLNELRAGIAGGLLNKQDEYGCTALILAALSRWKEGLDELLSAGADTELRIYRTGNTALYETVWEKELSSIVTLISAGANPDAANHWGMTPRKAAQLRGDEHLFEAVPLQDVTWPAPWIQNAEHLADNHYPNFKIPKRAERESLKPEQAVDLYVYGPRSESKQDTVKVRIFERKGDPPDVRYLATIETPVENIHLPADTIQVEFGPENVASVYVPRKRKARKSL